MCDHHRNAVARQCAPAPAGPPAWLSDGILMERPTRSIDAIGVRRGRDVTARVQLHAINMHCLTRLYFKYLSPILQRIRLGVLSSEFFNWLSTPQPESSTSHR